MKYAIKRWWYGLRSGRDHNEDYNVIHGKFYVIYKDGQRSRNACLDVCKDYAEMFGGVVIDNF